MKRRVQTVSVSVLLAMLSGCGSVNNALLEKTKNVEYYRIFDIKTSAPKKEVTNAASYGLGKNVGNAQEATPIPTSGELPDKPGRFKLVNPFAGSSFAALAGGGGSLGIKMATCDGAAWTANAQKNASGNFNLNLTACLFPYKEGYHLDLYATFTKKEGGLRQIGRSMSNAMVGTPEEWTEKTFLDIVRTIREKTNAEIAFLEGEPEMSGTPWLDQGASNK